MAWRSSAPTALTTLLLLLFRTVCAAPPHAHAVGPGEFADGDLVFVQPPVVPGDPFDAAIRATGLATISWLQAQNITVVGNQTAIHVAIAWHGNRRVLCRRRWPPWRGAGSFLPPPQLSGSHSAACLAVCLHAASRGPASNQHRARLCWLLPCCRARWTPTDTSTGQAVLKFVEAIMPVVTITPADEFFGREPRGTRFYHGRVSTAGQGPGQGQS